ncbi:hypothetical protein D3C72_1578570 [compost metagenome]
MTEKNVFIKHVVNSIDHQVKVTEAVILTVQFNQNTYEGIRMYLNEIVSQGLKKGLEIEEDSVPNTLLVIKD